MTNDSQKEFIDLADRNQAFKQTEDRLECLREGFYALAMDYGFHIENTWGGQHKIFELRDNVIYRFFSSLLHCQLLLRQHYFIEQRLSEIYKNDPAKILDQVYPKNSNFEYAEKEISAIFDSVVFHLSSIYDYLSILINFICVKDKDQTPKWMQLTRSARDTNNAFYKRDISKTIDSIDRDFAIKLYDYRSEIIHRSRDTNEYSFNFKGNSGEFTVRFICSPKLRKTFKNFGEKELEYTVSYFSMWLINKTADTVASILIELKKDIEKNSNFPQHTFKDGSKPFVVYADPVTNIAKSPSVPNWEKFKKHFNDTK